MSKLALKLPGFGENIQISPDAIAPQQFKVGQFDTIPELISQFLNIGFFIAGFVLFIMVFIGAYRYLTAGDNKENIAKARSRIVWAILGFLFVLISFALVQFIQQVFTPQNTPLVPISGDGK